MRDDCAVHRSSAIQLDVVIFGGSAAGLWLLDELIRRGYRTLLLEAHALGSGQTIASQGIIHGGLKYTLDGLLRGSAATIRDMPQVWRDCLAGRRRPDLTRTRVRAQHCHLWRTESLRSKVGMIGARVGLRVAPTTVEKDDRPVVLAQCPGSVARLDERVIDPASFLADLASQHRDHILKIDAENGLRIDPTEPQPVIELRSGNQILELLADQIILSAGAGNKRLREQFNLPTKNAMQRRPLHMVLARGATLPQLNGHCVDGAKTRVTITSDVDSASRTVWQVGGQIAEDGVNMDANELIAHAQNELESVLPGVRFSDVEWTTYRVDRAEGTTASGARPDDVCVLAESTSRADDCFNILTVWPTKLALVPRLVDQVVMRLSPIESHAEDAAGPAVPGDWPRPEVALPPWETATTWFPAH
jgi:glycerol-3-phosphate dehydrogenase